MTAMVIVIYATFILILLLLGFFIGWIIAKILHKGSTTLLTNSITHLEKELEETKKEAKLYQDKYLDLNKELAISLAEHKHLEGKIAEQGHSLNHIQTQLSVHFKNLANELLEEKSRKLTDHSQLQIERLLMPLGEKISAFEKQVAHANQQSLERNVALRTELQQLHSLNVKITQEAENLTKALKGDSKLQGGWGEFILEKILERSGLVKNREYTVQPSITIAEGQRLQPDIIVNLPKDKNIIIDSKVSLIHYEQFFNTENELQRSSYLKQYVQSIKRHIKTLSEKNYQSIYNIQGLDFILMFVPIEPAFSLAMQEDFTLFNEAYERNVIIVSPSNLITTLRTIANLWRQEYQNQNAIEIAAQGGALYDKFVGFVEDLKNIGRQLDLTQKCYSEATKKLYDGKGNLVSRAQKMRTLGARTSKILDAQLIDKASQE
ncbi:DNA recombination protein RmuC [Cardinium endosymbiont of Culicoides punctatus]|uniref:DNA recombination protein RmuC n=1 Tax=Cardinium endosymbiont of Culicoides punctatus TaxID=2304601 RepID=UPI0010E1A406|nr:DNA recombination protein RmuC [Cardinium endosymbiont of Culicoides punctatus]TDG95746.1 DNA recombination protein RmuC [Cardinium endosymbiont of Culicoides punctatus]